MRGGGDLGFSGVRGGGEKGRRPFSYGYRGGRRDRDDRVDYNVDADRRGNVC